ncbi:MAG TPA: PA2169 family four-helix-bundle protein [Candidatus Binataceae bacterium]|nr:PA2169 family four-helix-bundle protein [Candidatus Binataceae bacterium]
MKVAEALDRLIAVSIDGEKRYEHAAKDVERASLEAFFEWQAYNRKTAAEELAEVRGRLYGDGREHGTLAGLADRAALDFAVVMSKGDTGVVEWCREDDAEVIAEYEKALAEDLPEEVRLLLQRQLERVRLAMSNLEKVIGVFGRPRS